MLEILFLIWYVKKLAAMASAKGRSGGWGAFAVLGWVGGEVGGALLGVAAGVQGMGVYGYALLGAGVGAVLAYVIVRSLSPVPPPDFPTARVV